MLPAGYLLKRTTPPPGWLATGPNLVEDICSVSDCVNTNVVDVQGAWLHNGFGLANNPDVLIALVRDTGVETSEASLFYYTSYENEIESDGWAFDPAGWRPRLAAQSASVRDDVRVPSADTITLLGYDVVVFGDYLEHSPISCNSIAGELRVNEHCLLETLLGAVDAINAGAFGGGCEEGLYTIFAVYKVTQGLLANDS